MSEDRRPPDTVSRTAETCLVLAAQAGDRRALDQLVRLWHRRLVAHAWRLIGRHDAADEVVQGAWLEIMRGLPRLREARAFHAWAYRIVTRHAAKRVGAIVSERVLAASLCSEPAPVVIEAETGPADASRLRAAIATLSGAHRAAIALHYFEGLSIAEVAVALDVPSGTIKTRLMHARHHLRAHFTGDDDA